MKSNSSFALRALRTLALACVGLGACGYSHVEIELRTNPRGDVELRPDTIELEVGVAAVVEVLPYDALNRTKKRWDMDLYSDDADIVEVIPGPRKRDYVFQAHAPGETCVAVWWKHERRECIRAVVTPPLGDGTEG